MQVYVYDGPFANKKCMIAIIGIISTAIKTLASNLMLWTWVPLQLCQRSWSLNLIFQIFQKFDFM